jgi:hypothetical protein
MSIKNAGFLVALAALLLGSSVAQACETGQVLKPGDSCDLTVKWGFDHWIKAEFPEGGGNQVEFSHLEGDCHVSLFGPIEADEAPLLGPDQEPFRVAFPGEYHLFTRAIVVAQQICRYRVAVN